MRIVVITPEYPPSDRSGGIGTHSETVAPALARRGHDVCVLTRGAPGVEERDGVRFYVEPTSALEPIKLIRTPGLGRDRMPAGHPPPPPPERDAAAS